MLISIQPDIVSIGSIILPENNSNSSSNIFEISNIIRHPNYKASSHYDDIALIKLKTVVELSNEMRPACLAQEQIIKNMSAIATGYGHTEFGKYY